MTEFKNNQKSNQSYKDKNYSKNTTNSNENIVKENKYSSTNKKRNEQQKTYNKKYENRNDNNQENNNRNKVKDTTNYTNNKKVSDNSKPYNKNRSNNSNDKNKYINKDQNKFNKNTKTDKQTTINKNIDKAEALKENMSFFDITDKILKKNKKAINLTLLVTCGIVSLNVINNIAYNGSELSKIKKDNQILESDISKISKENNVLEKEIKNISSENEKLQEQLNILVDKNFKAVPGTVWSGIIKFNGQEEEFAIRLEIKNEEIILNANSYPWNRLEVEENEEKKFNPSILLSAGDKNKETGYLKLNRLSLKNSPQGLQEYEHEVLPYNYDIIFNKNYATGFILEGNNIKGTVHLQLSE